MSRFEKVRDVSEGYQGEAWLIRDTHYGAYFVVSRANTWDRGDETMIFASTSDGAVTDWMDLYAGYGEDHQTAIDNWESQLGA